MNVTKGYWSGIIDGSGNVVLSTDNMGGALAKIGMSPNEDMNFMSSFHEGLALAMIRGKLYYVDKSGNIPFVGNYTIAEPFKDGYARVYDGMTYDPTVTGVIGQEDGNSNKTYIGIDVIPGYRWSATGGSFHIIDKVGNILLSYPKELTIKTKVSKDLHDNDLKIGLDPEWNSNGEFPANLVKHVVYDEKEGIIVLKKK